MFPLGVIEVDVPECTSPYNYTYAYVLAGFGVFFVIIALIVAVSLVTTQVNEQRQARKLAEIRGAR